MARVAVVIPNWNGAHFLSECLDSLLRQTAACEIVVVDGASSDGSVELVRTRFPIVKLVSLSSNRGFAGAVNAGIRWALERGSEFVALLNNDAVAAPDWLEQLMVTAERHPDAGTVTAKLLRDRKSVV